MSRSRAVTLALLVSACEVKGDAITGACVSAETREDPARCVNLWDGQTACPDGDDTTTFNADQSCASLGFSRPCTYDDPGSLWVVSEEDCEP